MKYVKAKAKAEEINHKNDFLERKNIKLFLVDHANDLLELWVSCSSDQINLQFEAFAVAVMWPIYVCESMNELKPPNVKLHHALNYSQDLNIENYSQKLIRVRISKSCPKMLTVV